MTLFLTYLVTLWIVNAWHDADFYNKKDAHFSGAALSVLIGVGFLMLNRIGLKIIDIWDLINLIIIIFTIRWVIFDISYNLFIGQKWYFKGTTSDLDKMPNWLHFGLKILLIFISIPILMSFVNQIK